MKLDSHEIAVAWRDLCEAGDRTSPPEYQNMALITFEEFSAALTAAILLNKAAMALGAIDALALRHEKGAIGAAQKIARAVLAEIEEYKKGNGK